MKKILSYILLLFVFVSVDAADFKITVLNQATSEVIPNVTIYYTSISSDFQKKGWVLTDENGQAEFESAAETELSFSHVSYKNFKDTLHTSSDIKIYLEEDYCNMETITVFGTRTENTIKETPVLTQIISENEIERTAPASVRDILEVEIPGIELSRTGFGANMQVQGLEAQYTLILIDGERMAGETGGNIDYSRIDAANIDKIEVVRGTSSVLNGSSAMGSVVNITTKTPKDKWDIGANIRYAEMNQKNIDKERLSNYSGNKKTFYERQDLQNIIGNFNLGYREKRFYTNTFFNVKSSDAYQLEDSKGSTRKYYNLDTAITIPISDSKMIVNGFMDWTVTQKLGYTVNEKLNFEAKGTLYNHREDDFSYDNVHDTYRSYTGNLKSEYKINDDSKLNFSYTNDVYTKMQTFELLDKHTTDYEDIFQNAKVTYSGIFKGDKSSHSVYGSIDNLTESLKTDMFDEDKLIKETANDFVLILQDEIKFSNPWTIVAGFRGGYHSAYELYGMPSVTAKYAFRDFTFRSSYSRGFRSPSLKELYMDWSHLGMFQIIGNENLNPETNNFFSFSTNYYNSNLNLNLTAITSYNHIKNKIDGIWNSDETEYLYVNFDQTKLFNLELLAKWYFAEHFLIKGGYIFTHQIKDNDALNLSIISPHALNGQIGYRYYKKNYNLNATLSFKYTGKKKYSGIDSEEYFDGEHYKVEYDAYSIWNFSLNQKLFKRYSINAGIKNIFDYKAPIITFNTSVSPGRRFFVSLGYDF